MGHPELRIYCLLWLEEGDGAAGWVVEDGHRSDAGDFLRAENDGGAERAGFFRGFVDFLHTDVGEPTGMSAGERGYAATGAVVWLEGAVDHRGAHLIVLKFPAEECAVENLGFGEIGGVELEVDEWICHEWIPLHWSVARCAHH